jgi:hypothetical protein
MPISQINTNSIGNSQITSTKIGNGEVSADDLAATLNLTSKDVTLATIGFQAYVPSSYIISNATNTIVQASTEVFDTNGWYDTGNYRFTPQKAGWYYFICQVDIEVASGSSVRTILYKNGSLFYISFSAQMNGPNSMAQNSAYIAYANGSTDYFQFYCAAGSVNSPGVRGGSSLSFWSGTYLGA